MPADKQLTSAEIDALCDSFEQLCKSALGKEGAFPRIEDYLDNLAGDDRETVLRELLIIDHHYRSRTAEVPSSTEYHHRFAEHSQIVNEVLSSGIGHGRDTKVHTAVE